jgi:restriction system protein
MVQMGPRATTAWLMRLSRLPWWAWVLGAILAYFGLHDLAARGLAPGQGPGTHAGHVLRALFGLAQWLIPAALIAVAAQRWWRARHLRPGLTADPVGTALGDLAPSDFEALVAEVFQKLGYLVSESAGGYSGGRRELLLDRAVAPAERIGGRGASPISAVAHIRYWQAWRIGATEVRELTAAMSARGAARGFLVVPGEFTRDARHAAEGNSVEMIDGASLRALVEAGRGGSPTPASSSAIGRRWRLPHALGASRGDFLRARHLRFRRGAAAAGSMPRRRMRVPVHGILRLVGVLLAAAAILGGFRWITGLPDKRLAPAEEPRGAPRPMSELATSLVPEPQTPAAPVQSPPAPPPPPGLGGFRSVHELDAAFDAFYVAPPGCADPASQAEIVECANHRIRARKGYMAAGTPTEPEPVEDDQQNLEGDLAWDEEVAINALVPPQPDRPNPDATQWEGPDPVPEPPAPLPPRRPEAKDPAATYAPYDPKAPWVER